MNIPDIRSVTDFKGKRILLRGPLNVPLQGNKVLNDFRLKRFLPMVHFLQERGARVIIVGHIGRDPEESLEPICRYLNQSTSITFVKDLEGTSAGRAVSQMGDGEVVLLENLRQNSGEVANDANFSKYLASLADIYVNEAFSNSHRSHASMVGVTEYIPSYAGIEFVDEVTHLQTALEPKHPALFILGGAKFETKEPLIRKFLDIYDHVFVGGALANDFFKAKEYNVGVSLLSKTTPDLSDVLSHPNLLLPPDVMVQNSKGREAKLPTEVNDDDMILDAGPKTVQELVHLAEQSSFVLWNGPLGNYEKGFDSNTEDLARALAECSAECIVGGGDTVVSISKLGLLEKYTFVSTGGGSMLQFLLEGTLPALEALKAQNT